MRRSPFKRKPRGNKYGAKKTVSDGILFASKLESIHYEQLKLMQMAGEISDLDLQHDLVLTVNNRQICTYIADYFYFDMREKKWVVSDAKGILTDVFKLKWKLCKALFPEFIYEIRKAKGVIRE
jgi:hypothetical protein